MEGEVMEDVAVAVEVDKEVDGAIQEEDWEVNPRPQPTWRQCSSRNDNGKVPNMISINFQVNKQRNKEKKTH